MLDALTPGPGARARLGREGLALATIALFAALAALAADHLWPAVSTAAWLWTLVVGVALLLAIGRVALREEARSAGARFLGAAIVAFVLSRLCWVAWTPTLPTSDFAFYDWLGSTIATGGPIPLEWPQMGLIAAWGYGVLLGGAYAVLGHGLDVAFGVNVALGAAAVVAEYALARRLAGPAVACVACALFVLWPGQLFYSGVLGSEHLAVPLLLSGLLCVAGALEERPPRVLSPRLVFGGVLLCATFVTRSVLGAALPAAVLAVLLEGSGGLPRRVARGVVLVVVFVACAMLYRATLARQLGVAPLSAASWSVLVGANPDSGGGWSAADARRYTAHPSFAAANTDARAEAWRRISSDPGRHAALSVAKVAALWADGSHAVFWSRIALAEGPSARRLLELEPALAGVAQGFHVLTLVLAVVGMAALLSAGAPAGGVTLVMLVLLLTTVAHAVVETQSRYNYPLQPLLFVFAAIAVTRADAAGSAALRRP